MAATPASATKNWVDRMQQVGQKVTDGVNAVTESPMAKAAANPQAYLDGVNAAVSSGKWQSRLNSVPLATWKANTIAKASRIGTGATAAQSKMLAFNQQWIPFVQQVAQQVRQMPKGGLSNGIARMVANAQGLAAFKRQ